MLCHGNMGLGVRRLQDLSLRSIAGLMKLGATLILISGDFVSHEKVLMLRIELFRSGSRTIGGSIVLAIR